MNGYVGRDESVLLSLKSFLCIASLADCENELRGACILQMEVYVRAWLQRVERW